MILLNGWLEVEGNDGERATLSQQDLCRLDIQVALGILGQRDLS